MAKPRQVASGKWQIALRHPSLPGGRKYFLFDTEQEAKDYDRDWLKRKLAGVEPPAELLRVSTQNPILGVLIREWSNSGQVAPSGHSPLGSLMKEVGPVKLEDVTYVWLNKYIQRLKVEVNISPATIRQRIQALSRCIDEYLRNNPKVVFSNPVHLLPKGYSTYTDTDKKLVAANDGVVKVDVSRDRRLHPGEQEKIVATLSGFQRPDRERGLELKGGNALLTMFLLIVYSGVRLKEAYTLHRNQIDFEHKVIRVQSSKQWRGKIAYREVPMRPEVFTALKVYLSTRKLKPEEHLFPFMDEEPDMTIKLVSSRLSARYKIAFGYSECVDLTEHDLRHEATCRWLEMKDAKGNWMWRMEEVNKIMGWTAGSAMAQRYASFRGADMAQRMWATGS